MSGYDDTFLGIPLPLPRPLETDPVRLDYPRFTVLLDTTRRLAAMTGVNIDGETLREVLRSGRWRLDRRVKNNTQAGAKIYSGNDLDRGHLVRRSDPGWGSAADALAATEATFFYTNAAPQAAVFNQSKQLWLGLEDHVLEYADAADQRVSVFTAPVLDPDDPEYRGLLIPRRFFKVAAWASTDDQLAATGFVLDQSDLLDLDEGLLAVAPLGAYRTFQVPIGEIEQLAQVDLGDLVAADVLGSSALLGAPAWQDLTDTADIVLG